MTFSESPERSQSPQISEPDRTVSVETNSVTGGLEAVDDGISAETENTAPATEEIYKESENSATAGEQVDKAARP